MVINRGVFRPRLGTLAVSLGAVLSFAIVPIGAAFAAAPVTIPRIGGVPLRGPHANPAIFAIELPTHKVRSGDVVQASVVTSSNVASVEARIKGYGMNLEHVGVGRFNLRYHVPWLPFFLKGNWPVALIARNVDGVSTQKTLYIRYQ